MKFLVVLALLVSLGFVNSVSGRIINGQESEFTKYVAVVHSYNAEYRSIGGGSFISQRHVLTAANLVYGFNRFNVDYGHERLEEQYGQSATAVQYPHYNPTNFQNNIAILVLKDTIDKAYVLPIPLPPTDNPNLPYVNEQGSVTGFGFVHSADEGWIMNQRMQTGFYRRIENNYCANKLSNNDVALSSDTFCARDLDHESSICHGDHGSGLTVYVDEVNTLVGVVSVVTNMCSRDYPVVFTKVFPYLNWIHNVLRDNV